MRYVLFSVIAVIMGAASLAQGDVSVAIVAILVDQDLNQKPVPRLELVVRAVDRDWTAGTRTGFDGRTAVDLPPGRYEIASISPVRFGNDEYAWSVPFDVPETRELVLSNDNAKMTRLAPLHAPATDRKTAREIFPEWRDSVVTVWSEFGHGTGFFVDAAGLVLTNDHVLRQSRFIAVQSDARHRVEARLIERDSTNDLAVVWIAPGSLPNVKPVVLANVHDSIPDLVEGDQVFTIGSPLNQRKIITSGIASKIESGVIISDININPGNSGGPLFNDRGEVVGITTFGDVSRIGPGVSGIVRIETALRLIESARGKLAGSERPSGSLLPVEPEQPYPAELLKVVARFDGGQYFFNSGDYSIQMITPVSKYGEQHEARMAAAREKEKRTRKAPNPIRDTFQPLSDIRSWAAYAGELQAVLQVRVQPRLKETVGSAIGRGLLAGAAAYTGTATALPAARMRFRSDFYRMDLYCGGRVIQPILPSKYEMVIDHQSVAFNATDATYAGFYTYPYDAMKESCGSVFLRIYSEATPNQPQTVPVHANVVSRVARDFTPYDRMVRESNPPIEARTVVNAEQPARAEVTSYELLEGYAEGTFDVEAAMKLLDAIRVGMSAEEVLGIAGRPHAIDKIENVEMWKYSVRDRYLVVAFIDTRVTDKALTD